MFPVARIQRGCEVKERENKKAEECMDDVLLGLHCLKAPDDSDYAAIAELCLANKSRLKNDHPDPSSVFRLQGPSSPCASVINLDL
jgi:hypothetical protein